MRGQRLVAFRPNTMKLEAFDLPDTPPPGHLLAETTCTLISTGTELANYTGITVDRRAMGDDWRAKPYRPGYSYVGIVRAVGSGVEGIAVGDRVCGHGPHASVALLAPEIVAVVPEGVTDVQAAFVTLLIITMNAVRLAKIELGDRVAAVGLGLIGNLALQQARVCGGMPVVGTDLLAAAVPMPNRLASPRSIRPRPISGSGSAHLPTLGGSMSSSRRRVALVGCNRPCTWRRNTPASSRLVAREALSSSSTFTAICMCRV